MSLSRDDYEAVADAVRGRKGSGWVRANCPICHSLTGKEDRKQSLGFNTKTGGVNCPKCGSTGRLPRDLIEEIGIDLDYPQAPQAVEAKPNKGLPKGFAPLWGYGPGTSALYNVARDYLTGPRDTKINGYTCRGLDPKACEAAGIGIAAGFWGGRIIVPIPDMEAPGRFVGWFARDFIGRPDGKHLYCKDLDRTRAHFNWPALRLETTQPLYVVEGCLDVVALWPHAYALLGGPMSHHYALLAKVPRPVVILLDGDVPEKSFEMLIKLRMLRRDVGCIQLGPKLDPDEIPYSVLQEAAVVSLTAPGKVRV